MLYNAYRIDHCQLDIIIPEFDSKSYAVVETYMNRKWNKAILIKNLISKLIIQLT